MVQFYHGVRVCAWSVLVNIGGCIFMEEAEDDSELGPLCREHSFKKKSHVAKDSFPSWILDLLCFVFMKIFSTPSLIEKRQKKAPLEGIRTNGFKQI